MHWGTTAYRLLRHRIYTIYENTGVFTNMGYWVKKTALGLKPVNHTVESEADVYKTDGYCMSPEEYIENQKILSSQKEKIEQLQIEKNQEVDEILNYYKEAFRKLKKEYSSKLTCEIQSLREKYLQPLTAQKEKLLMAENQIQVLQDKLEVSNAHSMEQENLNKNLLRIMKERANADREIVPKKKHHGYIILYSQELYVKQPYSPNTSEQLPTWKTQVQTPYPVEFKSCEIKEQIFKDFEDNGIFSEMVIQTVSDKEDTDIKVHHYLFRANTRTGYWEIELYTTGEINIPQSMQQSKQSPLNSSPSKKKQYQK